MNQINIFILRQIILISNYSPKSSFYYYKKKLIKIHAAPYIKSAHNVIMHLLEINHLFHLGTPAVFFVSYIQIKGRNLVKRSYALILGGATCTKNYNENFVFIYSEQRNKTEREGSRKKKCWFRKCISQDPTYCAAPWTRAHKKKNVIAYIIIYGGFLFN